MGRGTIFGFFVAGAVAASQFFNALMGYLGQVTFECAKLRQKEIRCDF
jgi:hypothetical protein